MIGRANLQASGLGSVVVGGTVQGPVTTNVEMFASVSIPLTVARLDPAQVFDDSGVSGFVGREWLIEKLDQTLSTWPCGYIWIEAEAGLGKTAFAAWLVRNRGYLGHFSRQSSAGVTAAWQNLAAQLIVDRDLAELAPGGMLPPWAITGPGFSALLARAAPGKGQQLVLVIDGLDEIDSPRPGLLPLGLPETLPPGVFVIGTFRTGHRLGSPASGSTTLTITAEDGRNQRDIRDYLAAAVVDDVMSARLAEHATPPEEFCAALADRCGGVWVYLRYLLAEIRYGLRRSDELADLPATIWDYYLRQMRVWTHSPGWSLMSATLAALAVAGEPADADLLARFAGSADVSQVRQYCDLRIRPFLTATTDTPRRYAIYHASFRQFLGGELTPPRDGDHSDERRAVAEDSRASVVRAHSRAADGYLSAFGGLAGDLPRLAAEPALASADSGYPLRHLARHLDGADRPADLHRLLSCSHEGANGRMVNVWFEAHDHAATTDLLLNDIQRARRRAEETTDRLIGTGSTLRGLGLEIQYSLMTASLLTMTNNVGSSLLRGLVARGLWDIDRALGHARRLFEPASRADALATLAEYVPDQRRHDLFAEAVEALRSIPDPFDRLEALTERVPQIPEQARASVLAYMVEVAKSCPPHLHALASASVAALLSPSDRATVLDDAIRDVESATDNHYHQAKALTEMAPHLTAGQFPAAIRAAGAVVAAHELSGARALAGLAPYLPAEHMADALRLALAINDNNDRTRALAGILPHLPAEHWPVSIDEVFWAVREAMPHTYSRAEALIDLAPLLSPDRLDEALRIASAISDGEPRIAALIGLGPHLSVEQLDIALAEARVFPDDQLYARVVAGLAGHLGQGQLDRMLRESGELTDGARATVLVGLAPTLVADRLDEAVTVAWTISEPRARSETLSILADYLPAEKQDPARVEAFKAATTIADHRARRNAIAKLTDQLPTDKPSIELLTSLIPRLPTDRRPVEIDRALHLAAQVPGGYKRSCALAQVIPFLTGEQRQATVDDAVREATMERDDISRINAIRRLAPHLSGEQLTVILRGTASADDGRQTADLLSAVAPYLHTYHLPTALRVAQGIHERASRARALISLVPAFSGARRTVVTARAFRVSRGIADEFDRAHCLAELVPHLTPKERYKVLRKGRSIADSGSRSRLLCAIATVVSPDLRRQVAVDALQAAELATLRVTRIELLCVLLPSLPAEDRPEILQKAIDLAVLIDGFEAEYLLVDQLNTLATYLSTSQMARILEAKARLGLGLVEPVRVVLERSGEYLTSEPGIQLLRLLLRCDSREICLRTIADLAGLMREEAGPEAGAALAAAITSVCAWWP